VPERALLYEIITDYICFLSDNNADFLAVCTRRCSHNSAYCLGNFAALSDYHSHVALSNVENKRYLVVFLGFEDVDVIGMIDNSLGDVDQGLLQIGHHSHP